MKARKSKRDQNGQRYSRRGRRWLIAAPMVLAAAITVLWLAPAIVAHTFLKQQILSSLLSDFEGNVSVDSASLSWLSPLVVDGVEIRDRDGQPLADVASIRSERSLLAIVFDRRRLGRFQIERPIVHLELRPDGSNWQDSLGPILAKPAQANAVEQIHLEVIEGQIELLDTSGAPHRVDRLEMTVTLGDANAREVTLEAKAAIRAGQSPPGEISLEMAWMPSDAGTQVDRVAARPSGEGQLAIHAEGVPLEPLAASARQLLGDVQIEGTATCDAVYRWKEAAETQTFQIDRLQARDVTLRAPGWFGDDQLRTTHLSGVARAEADARQWQVKSLTLDTDFAQLRLHGSIGIAAGAEAESLIEVTNRLAGKGTRVDGQVDLARLASMLPDTLNLRPSTQLQSGMATLWIARESNAPGGWTAGLEATNLAAVDGGVRIQQQHPIRLTADFHVSHGGPQTYQVDCESAFLRAAVQGAGLEGSIEIGEANLEKLVGEVGPFVGLSPDQLSGRLEGEVRWLRATGDQLSVQGNLRLNDFRFVRAENEVWSEDQFGVDLAATADIRDRRLTRVVSGAMAVSADGDRLSVELLSPVQTPGVDNAWPIHARATGQLARWVPRIPPLRSVLSRHAIGLRGDLALETTARVALSSIQADSLSLRVDQFRASGPDLGLDEPVIQVQARGRWDVGKRRDALEVDQFLAVTQSIRLSANGRIGQLSTLCTADLTGEFQGDLTALCDRLRPILGPNIQLVGQETGQFAIRGPLAHQRAELPIPVGGQEADRLSVSMASTVGGRRAAIGVVSPDLQGHANYGWQSANIHGLIVGRGNLAATLEQGVIQFAPFQVPVSDGQFSGRPWIDLGEQPVSLCIDKGPLVENVRISPEMCRDWMKYVAPVLSNATRAEGRFSLALDRAKVPLADQTRSDAKGQLVIHSAKVGPGPLAQQILSIARDVKSLIDGRPPGSAVTQESTWLIVPMQTVEFDVRDGRVGHQRLAVHAGDLQIVTSGSVGLDESLALVVEVPIRDQWVAGRQYVDALRGTAIKVPVQGTFAQPRIDNRALRDLSRQMINGAAGRVLENELNRGLQRLFGS